jgi:hypothetical protein
MQRMYLAAPAEIADVMKRSRAGNGDTILYEHHKWGDRALVAGTVEELPENWKFTKERVEEMLGTV